MSEEHLAVYLNDHLAGAGGALELLSHLEEAHPAAAPALQGTDYARLKQRAEDQRRRVETQRLAAAKGALAVGSFAE